MGRKRTLPLAFVLAGLTAASWLPPAAEGAQEAEAAPRSAVLHDWMLQDHGKDPKECFTSKSGAQVEAEMVTRALEELGPAAKPYRETLDRLVKAAAPGSDPRWKDLYVSASERRRSSRLQRLVRKFPQIVFTKHYNLGASHYAYTEGQSDAQAERHFKAGAALCLLTLEGSGAAVQTLIEDPKGVIRDPDVSYDGKRILFAWKKSDRQDDYHLYEMNVASGRVRQLTSGLGYADYEAAYLPDGDIVFNSTRCVQIVDCWWTEVSNLYACDKDGKYLRRLTFDQVHTNFPQVIDDGRVVYTRWDYNDRGQIYPQPLFQMNPDGTAQTEYYGNNSWFPTTILHARGIPGTEKVVAVLSGHHCHQRGKLAIIDPSQGQQEADGVQLIAPVRETKAVRVDAYGQGGEQFQYPYPISETEFLVTYHPDPGGNRKYKGTFGIYWMDIDGRRELLAWDEKISCNQPVPLAPRKRPHLRPSQVDWRRQTGVYYVKDVYVGPGLQGIERGTVKRLRVVALEFRAAGVGSNGNGGPAGGALVSTPVSVRNGTWDVKRVLGTTPVYEDGSAMFTVPARTPVYFQLLDEKNQVVQTMRTWSTLQPGETFSCVGCHERKSDVSAPKSKVAIALGRGAQPLDPFYGPPRGFSFPKEIQPILNKHCTRCHNDRSAVPTGDSKKKKGSMPVKDMKPLLPIGGQWQYTTSKPTGKWQTPDFDSAKWKRGRAGFGTRGTPGGKANTVWKTPEIWLRRTFTLPANYTCGDQTMALVYCHDEDMTVYVNGVRVAYKKGHISKYEASPLECGLLRPGANVMAVHCRQTTGGQFIDVGILVKPVKAAPKPQVAALAKGAKKAFSMLDERTEDKRSKRMWSDSYLALTQNGKPNRIVNWLNAQSIPPMIPPYFAGAAKSELMAMLEKGHNDVRLSREEMDKIACWIDLLVPFCGDYLEANAWNDRDKEKYARYQAKRDRMDELDRANIEAMLNPKARPVSSGVADAAKTAYRNVALNPADVRGTAKGYPHASSNSECRGEPCFAARCAIDGATANKGHGKRFPSWGPDKRKDLWWKVEFGRPVEIDKVVLYIRADFPHDKHWHTATIEFSDGTREKIKIAKTADPQTFTFKKRTAVWLKFTALVQDEPLGWCAFTEVQVWGRDAKPAKVASRLGGPT